MDDYELDDFTIFPPDTIYYLDNDAGVVTIQFPTPDDAIIFYEFLASFVRGELTLEITGKKG